MAGRLVKSKITWAIGLAVAYVALGATPAAAGTLTLDFNAWTNAGYGSGCNLWSITPQPGYGYHLPCSGYALGMYAPDYTTVIRAGSRLSFQTTAPPGLTITSASVTMGLIQTSTTARVGVAGPSTLEAPDSGTAATALNTTVQSPAATGASR